MNETPKPISPDYDADDVAMLEALVAEEIEIEENAREAARQGVR